MQTIPGLQVVLDVIDALATSGEERLHVSTLVAVFSAALGEPRARVLIGQLLDAHVLIIRHDGVATLTRLGERLRRELGQIVDIIHDAVPNILTAGDAAALVLAVVKPEGSA
jgi:hypothetical protein